MLNETTKTILVTGDSGFVGRAIVRQLEQDNIKFNCLSQYGRMESYNGPEFDVIIHSASHTTKYSGDDLSFSCITNNVNYSGDFLEKALKPHGHLVLLSSCSVYGESGGIYDEKSPIRPHNMYGASKALQESSSKKICEKKSATCAVLRLAQVYGEGDTSSKIIPIVTKRMLSGASCFIVNGDNHCLRTYIYIRDVVKVVLLWLKCRTNTTCNVSGHRVSIGETIYVLEEIIKPYKFKTEYRSNKLSVDLVYSNKLLKDQWGFEATPIYEGLRNYVQSL